MDKKKNWTYYKKPNGQLSEYENSKYYFLPKEKDSTELIIYNRVSNTVIMKDYISTGATNMKVELSKKLNNKIKGSIFNPLYPKVIIGKLINCNKKKGIVLDSIYVHRKSGYFINDTLWLDEKR